MSTVGEGDLVERPTALPGDDFEEEDVCRVCRLEADEDNPMVHPCKCSGSVRYVHPDCLRSWLDTSQKRHCEICGYKYTFTKVYPDYIPSIIPPVVYLRQGILYLVRLGVYAFRIWLVIMTWLIVLPVANMCGLRGFEAFADYTISALIPAEMAPPGVNATVANVTVQDVVNATSGLLATNATRTKEDILELVIISQLGPGVRLVKLAWQKWVAGSVDFLPSPMFIFRGQILSIFLAALIISLIFLREWASTYDWAQHTRIPPEREARINPDDWVIRNGQARRVVRAITIRREAKRRAELGMHSIAGQLEELAASLDSREAVNSIRAAVQTKSRRHRPGITLPMESQVQGELQPIPRYTRRRSDSGITAPSRDVELQAAPSGLAVETVPALVRSSSSPGAALGGTVRPEASEPSGPAYALKPPALRRKFSILEKSPMSPPDAISPDEPSPTAAEITVPAVSGPESGLLQGDDKDFPAINAEAGPGPSTQAALDTPSPRDFPTLIGTPLKEATFPLTTSPTAESTMRLRRTRMAQGRVGSMEWKAPELLGKGKGRAVEADVAKEDGAPVSAGKSDRRASASGSVPVSPVARRRILSIAESSRPPLTLDVSAGRSNMPPEELPGINPLFNQTGWIEGGSPGGEDNQYRADFMADMDTAIKYCTAELVQLGTTDPSASGTTDKIQRREKLAYMISEMSALRDIWQHEAGARDMVLERRRQVIIRGAKAVRWAISDMATKKPEGERPPARTLNPDTSSQAPQALSVPGGETNPEKRAFVSAMPLVLISLNYEIESLDHIPDGDPDTAKKLIRKNEVVRRLASVHELFHVWNSEKATGVIAMDHAKRAEVLDTAWMAVRKVLAELEQEGPKSAGGSSIPARNDNIAQQPLLNRLVDVTSRSEGRPASVSPPHVREALTAENLAKISAERGANGRVPNFGGSAAASTGGERNEVEGADGDDERDKDDGWDTTADSTDDGFATDISNPAVNPRRHAPPAGWNEVNPERQRRAAGRRRRADRLAAPAADRAHRMPPGRADNGVDLAAINLAEVRDGPRPVEAEVDVRIVAADEDEVVFEDDAELAWDGDQWNQIFEVIGLVGPYSSLFTNLLLAILIMGATCSAFVMLPMLTGRTLLCVDPLRSAIGTALLLWKWFRGVLVWVRIITDPILDVGWEITREVVLRPIWVALRGLRTIIAKILKGIASRHKEEGFGDVFVVGAKHLAGMTRSAWQVGAPPTQTSWLTALVDFPPVYKILNRLPSSVASRIPAASSSQSVSMSHPLLDPLARLGKISYDWYHSYRLLSLRVAAGRGLFNGLLNVLAGYGVMVGMMLVFGVLVEVKELGMGQGARQTIRRFKMFLKLAFFLSLELVVFPLLVGTLMNLCAVPLFSGVTIGTRFQGFRVAALGQVSIMWLIGTMFMYGFAQVLSWIRSMSRKGALYFIRDPHNPKYSPVKEMIDRPTTSQARKLFTSILMYGFLVWWIFGMVPWSIHLLAPKRVLPLRLEGYGPIASVPYDYLLLLLAVPPTIHALKPQRTIKKLLALHWQHTTRVFRLTNLIRKKTHPPDQYPPTRLESLFWTAIDYPFRLVFGPYDNVATSARAPAEDSVVLLPARSATGMPLTKRETMFVPLDEAGQPKDARNKMILLRQDAVTRKAGRDPKKDFAVIQLPPRWRTRVHVFILFTLGCAGAFVGLSVLGPVLVGRLMLKRWFGEVHDGYSFLIGSYTLYATITLGAKLRKAISRLSHASLLRASSTSVRVKRTIMAYLKHAYALVMLFLIHPMLRGLVWEIRLGMLVRYGSSEEAGVVHIWDAWALGAVLNSIEAGACGLFGRRTAARRDHAIHAFWADPFSIRFKHFNRVLLPNLGRSLVKITLPFVFSFAVETVSRNMPKQHPGLQFRVSGLTTWFMYESFNHSHAILVFLTTARQSIIDAEYVIEEKVDNYVPDKEAMATVDTVGSVVVASGETDAEHLVEPADAYIARGAAAGAGVDTGAGGIEETDDLEAAADAVGIPRHEELDADGAALDFEEADTSSGGSSDVAEDEVEEEEDRDEEEGEDGEHHDD